MFGGICNKACFPTSSQSGKRPSTIREVPWSPPNFLEYSGRPPVFFSMIYSMLGRFRACGEESKSWEGFRTSSESQESLQTSEDLPQRPPIFKNSLVDLQASCWVSVATSWEGFCPVGRSRESWEGNLSLLFCVFFRYTMLFSCLSHVFLTFLYLSHFFLTSLSCNSQLMEVQALS